MPTKDVDNPARQPFQKQLCTTNSSTCPNSFQVPADRRLVIEFVSGTCISQSDETITSISIVSTAGGIHLAHEVVAHQFVLPSGDKNYTVSGTPTRIYGDPGTLAGVGLRKFSQGGTLGQCVLSLSGHTLAN